jgi:signal transduction histidine kinase
MTGSAPPDRPVPAPARREVRARVTRSVLAVVAGVALVFSVVAYQLVARSLRADALDRAIAEARFNVEVLAAERLGEVVGPGDIEASGLADDLDRRGADAYVDLGAGADFVTGLDVVAAPDVVADEMLALVRQGRVAAERLDLDGRPVLVVGVRRPPAGPDFYFLTDLSDIDATLSQLRWVLLAASLLLLLMAGVAARRIGRLAGSLADTVGQLTAARDRERRFVADVSHELRTPVTALVHEAAELADHLDALPAGTRRVVELLDGDVRRLRDLVEELLELSRLDRAEGAHQVLLDEVDVARFLAAVAARRLPVAAVRCPQDLRVRTDRRRLERIVANLLDNAREHGGGREVVVVAGHDGRDLRIEVADRGPGVPDQELDRIFDRFTKGDQARAGGGSGLGLAIVREHVRVLGGSVVARQRKGGGLVVEVALPAPVLTSPRPGTTAVAEP